MMIIYLLHEKEIKKLCYMYSKVRSSMKDLVD